ncbi:hypothetical protein PO909_015313 [Leuciscus waleckii]
MRQEVLSLLEKGAIERVPPSEQESGFYSRYFVVPKKDGGLRPILDLRPINRALHKRAFRMTTLKQILAQIRPGDWFASVDLKDAYFHIQIATRHRRFLRFAFEGTAYQYSVLPFGLALAPRTFSKCVDTALSPLRSSGMRILNYLDDWLILAHSRDVLISHVETLLRHLDTLGLRVNMQKSVFIPSQTITYLGVCLDSVAMRAHLSQERIETISSTLRRFRPGRSVSLREFQRLLGLMAAASSVCHLGLLHMRPLQFWLRTRVPPRAWSSGHKRITVTHSCVNTLRPWSNPDIFSPGVPFSNRQHVRGLVHKSSGRRALQSSVQTGRESPVVGGPSPSLHKSGAHPRSPEPWSRYAVEERDSSRRVEASPWVSPNDLGSIREGGRGSVCHKREHALPDVLLAISLPTVGRCSDIALAGSQALRYSSSEDSAYGVVQNQRGESVSDPRGPELAESALVCGPERVNGGSPMANPPQEGPAVSGEWHDMAPQPRAVEPSCVAAAGTLVERNTLHSRVLSTLAEARAPSTRRLYALKWGVFTKWCQDIEIDPVTSSVSDVLRFLQHRMDSGSLPSTLKVYVAAIAAFRSPVDGQSIGKHAMVTRFLRGARRLCPSQPPSVPPWDLALVLRALSLPPFEPLASIAVKELSLKTALLLALASAKRIGDLHAFSVNDDCICFGPGDCSVTLRPRPGYVPKSLNTPFRAQVVSLPTLSAEPSASNDADAQTAVCPVRALRMYMDRSAAFRQSDQLFVCFGGCNKGHAVSKQRLSHWIVDAIALAYKCQGKDCPLNIRAHSTRAVASSWAWSKGMSIQDLCLAAGWSSQNTFARFYKLDVRSVASQVLSIVQYITSPVKQYEGEREFRRLRLCCAVLCCAPWIYLRGIRRTRFEDEKIFKYYIWITEVTIHMKPDQYQQFIVAQILTSSPLTGSLAS